MAVRGVEANINWETVTAMCSCLCTAEEIAGALDICVDTLCNRAKSDHGMTFKEYWEIHSAKGKCSLRRAQYKSAVEKENVTAQIWLGKQVLGQREKADHAVTLTKPTFVDDVPDV